MKSCKQWDYMKDIISLLLQNKSVRNLDECICSVDSQINNYNLLIDKQKEYISLLDKCLNNKSGCCYVHGHYDSKEDIGMGAKLRKEIEELQTVIGE